jgi:hypothetical protein
LLVNQYVDFAIASEPDVFTKFVFLTSLVDFVPYELELILTLSGLNRVQRRCPIRIYLLCLFGSHTFRMRRQIIKQLRLVNSRAFGVIRVEVES